jgi:hypothetical protein
MALKHWEANVCTSMNSLRDYTVNKNTKMVEQTTKDLKMARRKVEGELTSAVP